VSTPRTLYFLLPGDPQTLTGGYIYDRRIADGLSALGWRVYTQPLDASFPFPTEPALVEADRRLAEIPAGSFVVIDGLALGAMPDVIARHTDRLRIVALIHHPLARETGLETHEREALERSERSALDHISRIIVTSPWTMGCLVEDGVPVEHIRVVTPGTDAVALAQGSGEPPLRLLCVATLTPRKGHAVLIDALTRLRNRAWQLDCVGSLRRDPATAEALRRQIERARLSKRINLLGELTPEELEARYIGADLFVLASYLEGYGMAHAEALAHGLPIISTVAGAIPNTVPPDAAVLVPPGDRGALARALASVLDDPAARERLAQGARAARANLPSWAEASARFAAELEALA